MASARSRLRLDELLVARGLFPSRSRARDAVLRGTVKVGGVAETKPGRALALDAEIVVDDPAGRYVSRAALKLVHALDAFGIDPGGAVALDIGASTGGFTQVLLDRGATHVTAVDVGHGQLHPDICADPRVNSIEGVNARDLAAAQLPRGAPSLIVSDVSFISLRLALPPALALAAPGARGVFLVKPLLVRAIPVPAGFAKAAGESAAGADYIGGIYPFKAEPYPVPSRLIEQFDISEEAVRRTLADTIHGADDGELFLERSESEALVFDNGRLKTANFNTDAGFGLRAVAGEASGYAHSSEFSVAALARAAGAVAAVKAGYSGTLAAPPPGTNRRLYGDENPIAEPGFEAKARLLQEIDGWLRARDPRVRQVTASLAASWQQVEILRADGSFAADIRPLVRFNVQVVVGEGDRQETGSYGMGGRKGFGEFLAEDSWKHGAEEALRQALVNLSAEPAPAGTFDIVLSSGWPGVMLHEAVGHGLEGDFNRKGTSAFSRLMGEQVAARGVTVVDDGTIAERRGSLTIDDEGTPTNRNVLIEDGRLVGYMQDRQNARLMGVAATGNGRRESYAHQPMPRMTNTYMTAGAHTPEEIIASVRKGIYAVSFGGGQVDITSGKFVFGCTEAYMIEDGKVTRPIKGAMLIGNGPDAMHRVSMVGNDMKLDTGIGMCGKAGQGVPVGVGQPHLRMDRMTVGGTRA